MTPDTTEVRPATARRAQFVETDNGLRVVIVKPDAAPRRAAQEQK